MSNEMQVVLATGAFTLAGGLITQLFHAIDKRRKSRRRLLGQALSNLLLEQLSEKTGKPARTLKTELRRQIDTDMSASLVSAAEAKKYLKKPRPGGRWPAS